MRNPFSFLLKKETILSAVLVGLLLVGGFFAVSYGSWPIELDDVFKVLLVKLRLFSGDVSGVESTIVWDGRMPRLIGAFVVGFSFASHRNLLGPGS
jgi:ABC-type Fe3+-siderophore transport system permease subunit